MCYMVYTNAQRQGAVINMTLGEVKRATEYTRGKLTFRCISVWEHKTTSSFGSAKVVLPEWVFRLLNKYAEGHDDSDLVFVTTGGEKDGWGAGGPFGSGKKVGLIHILPLIHYYTLP